MSPIPAIEPSARRDGMPEMNTSRPRASIAVAWENTPLGWRNFSERICCLGMGLSDRSAGEGGGPTQSRKTGEAAIGRAQCQAMPDRKRRQMRIRHEIGPNAGEQQELS